MKSILRKIPLRVQGVGYIGLLVLIVVAVVTQLAIQREKASFQTELEDQARLLVTTLSQSLRDPLITLDAGELVEMAEAMHISESVTRVRVYRQDGVPIVDTPEIGAVFAFAVDPLGITLVATEPGQVVFDWQADQLVAGHSVTVGNQRLGAVAVSLSTAHLGEKAADARSTGVQIAVVAVAVSIALSWLAISLVTRPIDALRAAALEMSSGKLDVQVAETQPSPELTAMAMAFNHMTYILEGMVREAQETADYLKNTISEYLDFVAQVANGDLTVRLDVNAIGGFADQNDDLHLLGNDLNRMVENLSEMATQVHESSTTLAAATIDLQAAATQLTATVVEQDASITETMATVEEIRHIVEQTAERAGSVAEASQQSVQVSRAGELAVQDTIGGMDFLQERVEGIAESILLLSERTQRIGAINETVNALADQSKLLALNASIEAARAGEEGKGFTVVAMEVRELADQSRAATNQVNNLLTEIQQATNSAVMVTEEGTKSAEAGKDQTETAGNAIRDLATIIEVSAQAATQIAASTHQQSNSMDHLTTAMLQIKEASTQSAVSTRQVEESVRAMTMMAKILERMVARYQLSA